MAPHKVLSGRVIAFCLVNVGMLTALSGISCPVGQPPPPGNSGVTGKFVGSDRCAQCHMNIHNDWAQTLHAKAYESLEAYDQGSNPDCLRCHTLGYGQPGGFVDRATTNVLASVQCENCHGAAGDHVANVNDETLRPKIDIAANVCGQCHTGESQPNFDDWQMSKHAAVEPELVPQFAAGNNLQTCGKCHSGDYFYHAILLGESIPNNYLQGKTGDQMNAITCAICHNPHARTGNAAMPDEGRDYQLRYPQIKYTTPTTDLAAVQDPTRFNLCGQCHHARDRVWTDSSREPHPSDQVNVFFGEIPSPAAFPDPIVPPRASVHLNTTEQCSTCHVARKPSDAGVSPAISGHTFEVNFIGCVECHNTVEIAEAKLNGLKAEIAFKTDLVKDALDAWAARNPTFCASVAHTGPCWEYTSEGGPPNTASGQGKIPDGIKKSRYIYYYVASGGGNGAHNPDFVRDALILAVQYANNAPNVP